MQQLASRDSKQNVKESADYPIRTKGKANTPFRPRPFPQNHRSFLQNIAVTAMVAIMEGITVLMNVQTKHRKYGHLSIKAKLLN